MNKRFLVALSVIFIVFAVIFGVVIWIASPYQPSESAISALNPSDSENYTVDQSKWLVFTPKETMYSKGIIFYPGGRVDPKAYSNTCADFAKMKILCVIVPMPFNLAIFNPLAGEAVIQEFKNIDQWIVMGHSLGGSMVTRLAQAQDRKVSNLIFLGSYSDIDITKVNVKVLSITAEFDGLLNKDSFEKNKINLPEGTEFLEIKGGNHSQFGSYGFQQGDNTSTKSGEDQRKEIVENISKLIVK